VKSVSCKGVRVQVVLLQAARSCISSPGSINTLQNITRFHLCVAEWVPGQLSMGPTLFTPVRLSSEECVLQGGEGASCAANRLPRAAIPSPGSIDTLQNITRFHLCVAEWVLGQLSMGPTRVHTCQVVQ